MSDENEIKAIKEMQNLNTNILLLTQAFNTYVETTDRTKETHSKQLALIEEKQDEHHDDIAALKFEDKCRQVREERNGRLIMGTFGGLLLMIIKTIWELVSKH